MVAFTWVTNVTSAYPFFSNRPSMSPTEEKELGDQLLLYVKDNYELIRDPVIVDYVNTIGQRIVAEFPALPFTYRFYVLKEDVYNAFAGPAGHVFINSGLFMAMENEEELAGILAHEVAHVQCRHIARRMEQAKKIGLATLAGVLAGIFLGGGSEASGAMVTGSLAAGQSLSLKYSREDETEADQVGVKYLTKAGYSPEGLLTCLLKIRSKRWFGPQDMPTYLSTHPAVESRVAYLDTWIQTHPEAAKRIRSIDPMEFERVQTRLIGLYGEPDEALQTFDSRLTENPGDALAYYGKGLVLERLNQKTAAAENLKKAVQLRPLDADMLRDLGKTYFHMGDYNRALNALKGGLAFRPSDPEGWFLLGRAQTETGDLEGALASFETLIKISPDYLSGIYYLGETYGKLNNLQEAHYYLGIYYKKKGQMKNARFHLNRALSLGPQSIERKQAIEEALKELSGDRESDRNEKSAL